MTLNKGQVAREHTPLTLAIAKQVKAERNAADLSQQELATRADMSITTYRRIESGGRPATVGQIDDIAKALGLTLSTMIRRAEDRAETAAVEDRASGIPVEAQVAALMLEADLEAERKKADHPNG